MIENLKLDDEAACLASISMQSVSKAKYQLMRVMSSFGDSTIKAVRCTIKGWQGIYLADRVTGTLYREEDGVCLTSTARRIVGPADKPAKVGAKNNFCYGTQPISEKSPHMPEKHRASRRKAAAASENGGRDAR